MILSRFYWILAAFILPVILIGGGISKANGVTPIGVTAVTIAPGDVIISEVAWGGTAASSADEWIELHNTTNAPITLTNWTLNAADGEPAITLNGTIPALGFFLLERTDDTTVSDIPADQIYTGALGNTGEALTLRDAADQIVDTANGDGGGWPAGSGSPSYRSMERSVPDAPDDDANWVANNGLTRNGLDANGAPLNGTPKAANSPWPLPGTADLSISKQGPETAVPGATLIYHLHLANVGGVTATAVLLTDTLPAPLTYITDSSGLPLMHNPPYLIWQAGDLGGGSALTFTLTAQLSLSASGVFTNEVTATTPITEANLLNNRDTAVTTIRPESANVLLDAVYYDGYETGDLDEAVLLRNLSAHAADLSGWRLQDNGGSTAVFPANVSLPAGSTLWVARDAAAFTRQFGFPPGLALSNWPGFSNEGDAVILRDAEGFLVDVLVYETGNTDQSGWFGAAVYPYTVGGVFAADGQILYRQRDQTTGLPLPDSNSAADWAQSRGDVINGRKVLYPGWDLDQFFFTRQVTETAVLTIAIAPDNAYPVIVQQIAAAQKSIQIEALTFENLGIAQALIGAAQRGVSVTVLLEGNPIGGIPDQEKYICQQLATANGQCWFMISSSGENIHDRYRFLHAKFILIDGRLVLISSENLSPNSLPDDDKSDGTWGRRGLVLVTDAPGVVQHVGDIFSADFAPTAHVDIFRWDAAHLTYGPPPQGFVPITVTGGTTYTIHFPTPLTTQGAFAFELVQSPENSLRNQDGLLGLVGRAGAGDMVLVQQLSERPYWGSSSSNPTDDPNPRLEAYAAAARRGATVRLLLDSYFDASSDPVSNSATCAYVTQIAQDEGVDMACILGNPAGLGIHNKMVLAQINGRGYIHVGSINGTEQSSKGNRELALQVQSDAAYDFLAAMFASDWPDYVYLPLLFNNYVPPANHVLISEVLYDPPGLDDAEFIELVNPTPVAIDISHYSIGDAVNPTDFEDVRRFPEGTILQAGQTLVIATSATAFFANYGFYPDFEIVDTETAVPDLIDDPDWGDPATFLQLGNQGDEVILRDAAGAIIDMLVYGPGADTDNTICPLVPASNYSLERYPYWRDTNICAADFRAWPFPNPGRLP